MSAKSSTFAPQLVEKMTLEQMTHTCWRCSHSRFFVQGNPMVCGKGEKIARGDEPNKCPQWEPTETARAFFAGELPKPQARTVAAIYRERLKAGTY